MFDRQIVSHPLTDFFMSNTISIVAHRYKQIDCTDLLKRVISMTKTYTPVTTPEELTAALARTRKAQDAFSTYTQEQVDAIFLAAASSASKDSTSISFTLGSVLISAPLFS